MLSHRGVGLGKRTQGSVSARAIRGTPRCVGLANWSKKLSAMVSLRILFEVFLCFVGQVHLGSGGLELLEGEVLGKLVMRA